MEAGSFSGAARKLSLSHPTVRARIIGLEQTLGQALFTRSPAGLRPTEVAEGLRETVRRMALASDLFVRQASSGLGEVAGTVRLSLSEVMGIEVIPPILAGLRQRHPALHVELELSNLPANLLENEVDIALRHTVPRQQALVARKVGVIPLGLYASRSYVVRRGLPVRTEDLADHDLIGPDRSYADLAVAERLGSRIRERLVLRTDSHPAQMAAARAGLGIAVFQVPLGQTDVGLVRVLPEVTVETLDLWLVTHENLAKAARVRAVLDHLAEAFARTR